jgi:hypothetical protein
MRLLCILLVAYRAELGYESEIDQNTIDTICMAPSYCMSEKETKRLLGTMIEHGGYYLNLEKYLGQGICFVLGTSLSES